MIALRACISLRHSSQLILGWGTTTADEAIATRAKITAIDLSIFISMFIIFVFTGSTEINVKNIILYKEGLSTVQYVSTIKDNQTILKMTIIQ